LTPGKVLHERKGSFEFPIAHVLKGVKSDSIGALIHLFNLSAAMYQPNLFNTLACFNSLFRPVLIALEVYPLTLIELIKPTRNDLFIVFTEYLTI